MDDSPSPPSSLLASEKHLDTNFKQRIFLAFFASLLPLAPLYWPSPADIRIASNDPCLSPVEDPHTFISGRTWINKQSCRWLGLACSVTAGLPHPLVPDETADGSGEQTPIGCTIPPIPSNYSEFWRSGTARPEEWDDEERRLREIPQFVMDYAPLIHLYSGEEFWPCDVASHLLHTTPYLNFTPIEEPDRHPDRHWNMSDLGRLGQYGRDVYLMSDDNVEDRPEWLEGKINIPNGDGDGEGNDPFEKHRQWMDEWPLASDPDDHYEEEPDEPADLQGALDEEAEQILSELKKRSLAGNPMTSQQGGRSDAPVILISVDKGSGIVDAFWFFFYSYNLGNRVFNVRFGNHIGDWEHTVVRFENGLPIQVFFSEHYFGEAYSYAAVEKIGKRVRLPISHSIRLFRLLTYPTSPSVSPPQEPTPCTPPPASTATSSPGASSTTLPIAALSGTPPLTRTPTPTTRTATSCARRPSTPTPQPPGSTSTATGATKPIPCPIPANTGLQANITMSVARAARSSIDWEGRIFVSQEEGNARLSIGLGRERGGGLRDMGSRRRSGGIGGI